MPHISESEFRNRFPSLIISSRDFPKKPQDINILFISAILGFKPDREYSEKEVNEELRKWVEAFGENLPLDHVTMRRYLVDAGYILRDADGSSYSTGLQTEYTFDDGLRNLDLPALVQEAIAEREERKRKFMQAKEK